MKKNLLRRLSLLLALLMILSMTGCKSEEESSSSKKKKTKKTEDAEITETEPEDTEDPTETEDTEEPTESVAVTETKEPAETTKETEPAETTEEPTTTTEMTTTTEAPTTTTETTESPEEIAKRKDLENLKSCGEDYAYRIRKMDSLGISERTYKGADNFSKLGVSKNSLNLYAYVFDNSSITITNVSKKDDEHGTVTYKVEAIDLTDAVKAQGEVYTYTDVLNTLKKTKDLKKKTVTVNTAFVLDQTTGKYICTGNSGLINVFKDEFSKIVIKTYMTQTEVNSAVDRLKRLLIVNDYKEFNRMWGADVLTDLGGLKNCFAILYQDMTLTTTIVKKGVTSTNVKIHVKYHDYNEALDQLVKNPTLLAPAFEKNLIAYCNNRYIKNPRDLVKFTEILKNQLPKAKYIEKDITCTINKDAKGNFTISNRSGGLVLQFDPDKYWKNEVPVEIIFATADAAYEAGRMDDETYDWIDSIYDDDFIPITVERGKYATYTDVYAVNRQWRWLPGVYPEPNFFNFNLVMDKYRTEEAILHVVWYRNGKEFWTADYNYEASNISSNSFGFGIAKTDKSKFYEAGNYEVVVCRPNTTDQIECKIRFTIP